MDILRILVVDDEPGMRLGVTRALRDYTLHLPEIDGEVRFELDQAESAEQALEKITERPPDLLLLDHKLPGLSGLDVLDRLGSQRYDLLTIMITAYATLDTAVMAVKRGAYDFLAKPFTPAELKDTIRKASEHLVLSRQARKLAQEKRQVRFQFISVLAHELKAPLGAIEGFFNVMKDRSAGENIAAYETMIDRGLIRIQGMRKMIADLLDLTRIESGQKQREMVEVNIQDVAQMAIETVQTESAERGINITLHAEGDVRLTADRGEMEIILNNLITNAVKYNRDGGRVEVVLSSNEQEVVIQVSDTGIGMSREESAKLFSEFVRIKNDKTRMIMGSGLGLSIVKKLALLYGGDVSVKSEPDVGSTFTVILRKQEKAQGIQDESKRNPELVTGE